MIGSAKRQKAKENLWYYLNLAAELAGDELSMDSRDEIDEIVDAIVDAAVEEMLARQAA